MTSTTEPTERTRVRRIERQGHYDTDTIYQILDEALICHVAFVHEDYPVSIPVTHSRIDDTLYLHGSAASRLMRTLTREVPISISAALVDGMVIGRSIMSHTMNYRSVVLFGTAEEVTDEDEKRTALRAFTDHYLPDRWANIRPPSEQEWAMTKLNRVAINEASAKVRTGPPVEETEEDYSIPTWAGVIPLRLSAGDPIPGPRLHPAIEMGPEVQRVIDSFGER